MKDGHYYAVGADSYWFLYINGICINNNRSEKDFAGSELKYWNIPSNIGYAKKDKGQSYFSSSKNLFFSGSGNESFSVE